MPVTLAGYTSPKLPSLNGEGPYDKYPVTTDEVDNRYRVRQAGHVSSLSNAQGFTYGVTNLGFWQSPSSYFALASTGDMQRLVTRFKNRAALPAHHDWILNQVTDPNHEKKMVLASDGSSLVLAYLPGDTAKSEIIIKTSDVSGLICGGTWTMKWFNPPNNALQTSLQCTQGTDQISLRKPSCILPDFPDCDWVLEMQRTGAALAGPSQVPVAENLELWADLSPEDGTSAIYGRLVGPGGAGEPILISPAGEAFQQSPRVARLGDGYLVVWHAEGSDESLYGVLAQQIDRNGRLLGSRRQVNTYTEHDQKDPAVASDAAGNAIVVWSSYGQGGDFGGIFGQRFDRSGKTVGPEFAISNSPEGHKFQPQIASDTAGNFVVAWNHDSMGKAPASISLRRFNRLGEPASAEVQMASPGDFAARLVDLQVSPVGGFSVRWAVADALGASHGQYMQPFDSAGHPVGPPVKLLE